MTDQEYKRIRSILKRKNEPILTKFPHTIFRWYLRPHNQYQVFELLKLGD